jgi:hypothetical protein
LAKQSISLFKIEAHLFKNFIRVYLGFKTLSTLLFNLVSFVHFDELAHLKDLSDDRCDKVAEDEKSEDVSHLILLLRIK